MILAGNAGVVANAIREIFGLLDKVVYWVLVHIVNLLTDIARTNVLTESTIQTFANRIYFIMGTIMFFKMAVSIITYIVDPDKLTDSKTGFASIIKNTVIALVMVVAVPIVFRYAMFAQEAILQDDTIGRLITGKTGGTQNNVGDTVATNILSGFIHPDEDIVGDECNNLGYSEECKAKLATYSADLALTYSYIDPAVRTSQGAPGSKYGYAHLIDLGTANDVHKTKGAKDYVIDYKIFLSTLAGGFAVYIFLLSCFDVAVRTVKFAFLQIIAPIPIATYIDEKGKTMFNNWRKACVSTYVDLFVRLAAVQFGIFMITEFVLDMDNHGICSTQIQNGQIITGACRRPGIFVEIFIIFGILLFIKEVPKLVEQITGIKLDGKFEMNPLKKMASVPLLGTASGNLARKALSGVDAMRNGNTFRNGWHRARENDKGFFADMRKTFDTALPYSADARKKRYEGMSELDAMHRQWRRGDAVGMNNISALDGKNREAYERAGYRNGDYITSLMNVDNEGTRNKNLRQALIEAQALGSDFVSANVNGETYGSIAELQKAMDTSDKTLKGYERTHESMRKRYTDDARLEDAIKVRKYNDPDDPTDVRGGPKAKSDSGPVVTSRSSAASSRGGGASASSRPSPDTVSNEDRYMGGSGTGTPSAHDSAGDRYDDVYSQYYDDN